MTNTHRFWASIVVLLVWLAFNRISAILVTPESIAAANLAGKQFESSDSSEIVGQTGMSLLTWMSGTPFLVVLGVLILIWWIPITKAVHHLLNAD